MRILLSFLVGLIVFFYLAEVLVSLSRKTSLNKLFSLNHSIFGIFLIISGFLSSFFTSPEPFKFLFSIFLIGSGFGLIFHHLFSKSYILSERIEMGFAKKHEGAIERLLEIFPGALTWLALTSPIWLSFTLPFAVAYLIILADVYWFISAVRIAILLYVGYKRMEFAKKQDWLEKLKKDFPDTWDTYYHFVEIHSYKESLEVLEPAFEAVINSHYPGKKIFFGIGLEERDDPEKIAAVLKYVKKHENKVAGIFVTIHPFGMPGEIPGPASNRNFLVRNAVKEFAKRNINQEQVIVTTLDADFVIHPKFLAGALHKYLSTPENIRDKRTFTGAFLYNNNYWQAPTPMRIIATGTAFWQLSEMVGSDKYINFSSLSINMKSLLDIGLWIPDKVNDDSGFYWKAYYHFKGDYKVIPHYLPISADACLDTTLVKTFQNQYLQLKRWAYGVEHIPFIMIQFFKNRDMAFGDKTDKLTFILWSNFKWGTLALFITFGGFFIPLINPGYSESVVSHNLNIIASWILTAAFVGLFSTIYVNEKLAPKRPSNWSLWQKIWSYLQWIFVPIALVSILTIPALDAQTRLMLGKYMEFRTTNKARIPAK
ncbi:MAG: hypothetical protein Q7R43_03465 [Candidatus Daviesbacteria bacterium]|nr:hypothetical protein [Candidatus Daviesbacteria bacterium]